ncbi:hypothetical protein GQ53DRAFT_768191 [Thozetella sp. PMI_491]|nr:hypothetical protein GQ53DRAFT_768191 [Thozetella sp. PMI_491]
MAKQPGFQSFSRFRELNVKNLLYYQVELAGLEADLQAAEESDVNDGFRYNRFAVDMIESHEITSAEENLSEGEKDRKKQQSELVFKIRLLLKEYNEALLQYEQISQLPEPNPLNVEIFRRWLRDPTQGDYCIGGNGSSAWGKISKIPPDETCKSLILRFLHLLCPWPREKLMVQLDLTNPPRYQKSDFFTRWAAHECLPFWDALKSYLRRKLGDEEKNGGAGVSTSSRPDKIPYTYSGTGTQWVASSAATIFTCVLPTVAIGILATAQGLMQRLLYIGGFTALFAVGLIILTDCRKSRINIFTATAAFSAVLVVFIPSQ